MKNLVNKIETLEEEVQKNEKDFAKKFFINEMKKNRNRKTTLLI